MTYSDTITIENESPAETEEREAFLAYRPSPITHDSEYMYGVHEESDEAHALGAQDVAIDNAVYFCDWETLASLLDSNPWYRTD